MRKHKKQIDAFTDQTRFQFWLAGRRGGKTYAITEKILEKIDTAPYGGEIFYIGPTNQQAKEIIWEPLEDRLYETGWNYRERVSKSRFELSRKRKIYVIGAEKIRRVRGHKLVWGVLDELAFFETDLQKVWNAMRPALTDLAGGAVAATTPDGKGTQAYDFYLASLEKDNWAYHHWKTIDNPYIDPAEIAEARRELDEKSFRQEYEATWESFEGLAYYNFSENVHIKKQPPIDPAVPLHVVFDFNVNPSTLLISQKDGDRLRYKREYSLKNCSTEATVEVFCEDFKEQAKDLLLFIRGDSTGKNRSASTGRSDYFYVEQILEKYGFQFQKQLRSKNPPIIDRVKTLNGWLKPVDGEHRIEFDPSMRETIRDLSSQELSGRLPSPSNNLGHKADAVGYDVFWENESGKAQPQRTIQL